MKLLVLGGTRFLGRHLVDAALARGHDVTIFTRGVQPCRGPSSVAHLVGNRDPRIAPGLGGARRRRMGRRDRHERLRSPLRRGVGRRCSKTASGTTRSCRRCPCMRTRAGPGVDETAPVATLDDPASEDIRRALRRAQGALRGRGPRGVRRPRAASCVPGSSSVRSIRPIASPTGSRASLAPSSWAREAGAAVVPAPPDRVRPIHRRARSRVVDARHGASGKAEGTFDACSSGRHVDDGSARRRPRRRARARAGSPTVAAMDRRRSAAPPRRHAVDRACRCGFPRPTPSRRASCISPARARWRRA